MKLFERMLVLVFMYMDVTFVLGGWGFKIYNRIPVWICLGEVTYSSLYLVGVIFVIFIQAKFFLPGDLLEDLALDPALDPLADL
jgi:hypothetical protein